MGIRVNLTLLVSNIRNQAIDKHIPNVFLG